MNKGDRSQRAHGPFAFGLGTYTSIVDGLSLGEHPDPISGGKVAGRDQHIPWPCITMFRCGIESGDAVPNLPLSRGIAAEVIAVHASEDHARLRNLPDAHHHDVAFRASTAGSLFQHGNAGPVPAMALESGVDAAASRGDAGATTGAGACVIDSHLQSDIFDPGILGEGQGGLVYSTHIGEVEEPLNDLSDLETVLGAQGHVILLGSSLGSSHHIQSGYTGGFKVDILGGMPLTGDYLPSTSEWARVQAEAYESSSGAEASTLDGRPIIVLTTRGARTGALRKTALIRIEHDGDYAVVASQGGAPRHPAWYWNILADPEVELQDGASRSRYRAREVTGAEKAEWWSRAVSAWPPLVEYQAKTDRVIPLFVLSPA